MGKSMMASRSYKLTITLLILLIFYQCNNKNSCKNNNYDTGATGDSISYYKNCLGIQTATVKTLELDKKQLKNQLLNKDKTLKLLTQRFSKINSVIKFQSVIKTDTLTIAYKDSIPYTFERADSIRTNWYSFNYTATQKGLQLSTIRIPNTVNVITGTKKKWFLGKQYLTAEITNSNPFIKTEAIQSAEIVISQPLYKKWYVWLGAGVIGGIIITH